MSSLPSLSDGNDFEILIMEENCTFEEMLISSVEARPVLWDSRLPIQERSKTKRDEAWLEIKHELGGKLSLLT
ncbi:hypothetical protein FQR65_LT12522 [Abscondita terminalis]|nr:hypothetical protein FQR65_LT12522 [Abscondita terminalis]